MLFLLDGIHCWCMLRLHGEDRQDPLHCIASQSEQIMIWINLVSYNQKTKEFDHDHLILVLDLGIFHGFITIFIRFAKYNVSLINLF